MLKKFKIFFVKISHKGRTLSFENGALRPMTLKGSYFFLLALRGKKRYIINKLKPLIVLHLLHAQIIELRCQKQFALTRSDTYHQLPPQLHSVTVYTELMARITLILHPIHDPSHPTNAGIRGLIPVTGGFRTSSF